MSLSQKLHAVTPTWHKTLTHPFVAGLGNGSLPLEKFQFYMCQDYIFLIEYSRVLALATAKAPDLDTMGRFAQLLDATLNQEMALHRAFAAECGISVETLEANPGRANHAGVYESFSTRGGARRPGCHSQRGSALPVGL